jgi:sugar phosphate isomerase/epimerase
MRPVVFGDEPPLETETSESTGMGLVVYCRNIRRRWLSRKKAKSDLFVPLEFLKHCHKSGTGGMQIKLGALTPQQVDELREYAGEHQLFIDAVVSPPKDDRDIARFESEIRLAADVKVQAARTVILPGRRYERFSTLDQFREFEKRGQAMLERAAPVVQKHQVRLAVENHKDQRLDERVALFRHLDSEFIGACVDTGNSFALLDDPYETIEQLAPFAFTVHLKDQALRAYQDGFLLGDIALGDGSFDLKRMVNAIKRVKPDIRFALELITRDALEVPCLNDQYWSTMPKVPASDLAAALRFVRDNSVENIPSVSTLSLEKQVALEDDNVQRSIDFARDELGL